MHKLMKSLDEGKIVVGIFLDFSRAFATVDHSILLSKLYNYGIRGTSFLWFQSYSSNRKQFVTYGGVSSSVKPFDVAYHKVLYWVLYCSLYILMTYLMHVLNVYLYYSQMILICLSVIMISQVWIIFCLGNLLNSQFGLKWKNYRWTLRKLISWSLLKKHINGEIDIKINNQAMTETKSSKSIGVYIDNNLNWKILIDYNAGKLSRGIGILYTARTKLSHECLLTLYYIFIYPLLIYCNHIWGNI